jgi:hypothetical protein
MIHTAPYRVTELGRFAPGPSRSAARMGDTTSQIVGASASTVSTALATVQAASSAGLITRGGTLAASIPVAGAVVAIGILAFSLLHDSRGAQQKVETTVTVDRAERIMKANLEAWLHSPKSLASQAQSLQNFDQAWAAITNFCGNGNEGNAGQRCISERQSGGKYDYFAAYRDPIANDPHAGDVDRAAAAIAAADPVGALLGQPAGGSGNWTGYAIAAALLLAALVAKS